MGYSKKEQVMCANLWFLEAFMPAPERSHLIVKRGVFGQKPQDCAEACNDYGDACQGFEFNNVNGAEECILVNNGCRSGSNWVTKQRSITLQMANPYCEGNKCSSSWKFGPYHRLKGFPEMANKKICKKQSM